ncbi:cysteine hydrolase family protein [Immundisolibacter sp.]|uniref:cysteine hydrolase family protein n=1 Tax=Immundisolibacter sp. TaxID=1934948 RepID=UPI003567219B
MAISIDKSKTALLVMDVQNDITHIDSPMARQLGFAQMIQQTGMLNNLRRLMDACRANGVPVVHVLIDLEGGVQPRWPHRGGFFELVSGGKVCKRGTWGGEAAELVKPLPGEAIVYKCIFSAFVSSGLQELLDAQGITDLILSGVSTDAVVESTAWDANDRGYSNILAENCCIAGSQEAHDISVQRMAGRCDVAKADEIIAALA